MCTQVLVWREALAAVRNPADVAGRMLTFVWVAIIGNFLLYGGGQAVSACVHTCRTKLRLCAC